MMRWLRKLLTSDDPLVKLVAQLPEPEALMRKELLENHGVPALVKDMSLGLMASYGGRSPFGFAVFVRQRDVDRAAEILASLIHTTPQDGNGDG